MNGSHVKHILTIIVVGLLIIANNTLVLMYADKLSQSKIGGTAGAQTNPVNGFQVEVISAQTNPTNNSVEVNAVMSGIGLDPNINSVSGTYKTPITFEYPMNSSSCNGVGLIDIGNGGFYSGLQVYDNGTIRPFDAGSTSENLLMPFPHLIPASTFIDKSFLFGSNGGYVYAYPQVERDIMEIQRSKGSLADTSWHIDEGSQYAILRDTSLFLRNPEAYIVGSLPSMPCRSSDVIGAGFSYIGGILRGSLVKKFNSKLGAGSGFDAGKVFEGTLILDLGSCLTMQQGQTESAYSCPGATPESEGKVISLFSQMGYDISTTLKNWNAALQARPGNDSASSGWYRVYDMAGTTHAFQRALDAKNGLRLPAGPTQAYYDWSPMARAALVSLTHWVKTGTAPVPSVYFTLDQNKGVATGADGNAIGGIRSPNVRTKLPSGEEFGAPLGVYKGTWFAAPPLANLSIFDVIGGYFTPYTSLSGSNNKCDTYYPTHQAYTDAATKAIDYGISQGWYLADDRNTMIQTAEQDAITYGAGCVPPSNL